MFARSAFRAAVPMKQQIRRYSTDPPPFKPPNMTSTYALLATAVGIGGAGFWVLSSGMLAPPVAAAKKAEAAVSSEAKKAFTGGDQGFISLKLEDVQTVNHNTKRFRFALPEEDMVSGLQVASALGARFKPADKEKNVMRPYTPISDESDKGFIDLLVKKYEGGPMSTHMHDMVPGQRLEFKGPFPKYPWAENKHEHIALVAGGTGITPMYQLCRAIFNNPADRTKVTLVFGNVKEEDILLKKELEHLENTYPQRFRAFYVLDDPPKEWVGGKGFITKDLLKTVLPEPKSGNLKVFVCGPPGLMKAISGPKVSPKDQGELTGVLKELGYTPEQVYKF